MTRKSKNSDLKIKKHKKQKPNFLGFLDFLKILKNLGFLKWVSTALMRWDIELLRALHEPRDYATAATRVESNREAATQGATTRHRPAGNYE